MANYKKENTHITPLLREEIFWPDNAPFWGDSSLSKERHDSNIYRDNGGHYSPGDNYLLYGKRQPLIYSSNRNSVSTRAINMGRDSFIWCFCGPRGAGKTSLMSYIAEMCAYLYGKRIISNYPIHLRIWSEKAHHIIEIKSEPLELGKLLMFDKSYEGAIIVIDEAPQIINRLATMTWKNRLLDLWLQQIRKNNNSLLYASQNEFWVDNELRWQTDLNTRCRDAAIFDSSYRKGAMINAQTRDMSGLWTGYSFDERPRIISKKRVLTQLIWGTFDTRHKLDVFASLAKVKMNVEQIEIGKEVGGQPINYEHLTPIVRSCISQGKVKKRELVVAIGPLNAKAKLDFYKRLRFAGVEDCGGHLTSYDFKNFDMNKYENWGKS